MGLKIIAAVAANGVIGKDGKLLWRLPDDMEWFRDQTGTSPVVMGRKTYWSLPERFRPLPNRENFVLSRHPHLVGDGVFILNDFRAVVEMSRIRDIFVMGGGEIYALALPHADEMLLTRVHVYLNGNVYFPAWHEEDWNLIFSDRRPSDERNQYNFTWEIWKRAHRPASL